MGDVFEAMNRAKKEQGSSQGASTPPPVSPVPPASSGASGAPGSSGSSGASGQGYSSTTETGGGLQLPPYTNSQADSVQSSVNTLTAEATTLPDAPVAAAVDRAGHQTQGAGDRTDPIIVRPNASSTGHASLNGYSPEVVVHHDRGSIVTEQYRAVRTQILARCKNRRLQIHVLTSAAPGEGKTISTLNLGMAFSEIRNQKTLLLEADLRRPTFATYFGRPSNPGLTEYLRHQTDDIDAIVRDTVYDNLQYIAAGEGDPMKSTELLSSPRMLQLLDRLRDRYDFIFIDTPPVVTVTDPCILGSIADQTILVVRLNKTASQVVDRAKRLLRASNCEVAGVILTHLSPDLSRYGYRYTYGYTSK